MLYGAIAAVLAGAIIVVYLVIQKRRERETVYELGDEYHQAKPAPLNVERQISSLGETGKDAGTGRYEPKHRKIQWTLIKRKNDF